jgi:hypothetical protein
VPDIGTPQFTPRRADGKYIWEAGILDGYGGTVLIRLTEGHRDCNFSVLVRDKRGEHEVYSRGWATTLPYAMKAALAVAGELVHPEVLNA